MYYGAIDCTSLSSVHLLDGDSCHYIICHYICCYLGAYSVNVKCNYCDHVYFSHYLSYWQTDTHFFGPDAREYCDVRPEKCSRSKCILTSLALSKLNYLIMLFFNYSSFTILYIILLSIECNVHFSMMEHYVSNHQYSILYFLTCWSLVLGVITLQVTGNHLYTCLYRMTCVFIFVHDTGFDSNLETSILYWYL